MFLLFAFEFSVFKYFSLFNRKPLITAVYENAFLLSTVEAAATNRVGAAWDYVGFWFLFLKRYEDGAWAAGTR